MKLISVTSNGNRLARVILRSEQPRRYDIYGKRLSYAEETGLSNMPEYVDFAWKKRVALKAAEEWLEGAQV
jgi:hypothetical protein